jgi:hypothetical protein
MIITHQRVRLNKVLFTYNAMFTRTSDMKIEFTIFLTTFPHRPIYLITNITLLLLFYQSLILILIMYNLTFQIITKPLRKQQLRATQMTVHLLPQVPNLLNNTSQIRTKMTFNTLFDKGLRVELLYDFLAPRA